MATQFINLTKLRGDLIRIDKTLAKIEDVATTRALNELAKTSKKVMDREIKDYYGVKQSTLNRTLKVTKAKKGFPQIAFRAASSDLGLIRPNKLKRGISHIAKGGKRNKITEQIGTGTKPFRIQATKGKFGSVAAGDAIKGKFVAVFREKGSKRRVTRMRGSSVPHMMKEIGINQKLLEFEILRRFPREYKKQLKKAKFTGRF